jgi:hypothetical protein
MIIVANIIKSNFSVDITITRWCDNSFLILLKNDEDRVLYELKNIVSLISKMEHKKIWSVVANYKYSNINSNLDLNSTIDNILKK